LDHILSQFNPVYTLTPYFCKLHFIKLPSTPVPPKWSVL
jgi:hypothetical protein